MNFNNDFGLFLNSLFTGETSSTPISRTDAGASKGLSDTLLAAVFGKNDDGSIKTLDLSKYVKAPEVNLAFDSSQLFLFFGFLIAIVLYLKKKK